LIDTNVILDIALERQPFVEQAVQLLKAAQQANIILYMTATTITDLYYIARREKGHADALDFAALAPPSPL
jgi:predicted nucleic acid-binding protein